jgi:alpha-L-fucosidase
MNEREDMAVTDTDRRQWFSRERLGLFLHWGCYSVHGQGEQAMYRERIQETEYRKLANQFHPKQGFAEEWAEWARAQGFRYLVLTTRHHDGYSLFDSKHDEFNAVKTGPGRDLITEFVEATRAAGLKVGLYYSIVNWRYRGQWDADGHPHDIPDMIEQVHGQVEELMTGYGKIDVLWYDVPKIPDGKNGPVSDSTPDFWRSPELNATVRKHQPGILINDRSGMPQDLSTPEQTIPTDGGMTEMWETCMTINTRPGWGYHPHDSSRKSASLVVYNLVEAVRAGGNFLINVGPRADGSLDPVEQETIEQVGKWITTNGEALYDAETFEPVSVQPPGYYFGMWTRKGTTGYFTVTRWPTSGEIVIPCLHTRVVSASMLATGELITFSQDRIGRLRLSGMPGSPPDALGTVLKVEFDDVPSYSPETPSAAWLDQ